MFLVATGVLGVLKGIGELIVLLLIFIGILFLAYWSSKIAARFQSGSMKNRNMTVVETMRVQNNKFIQIIKIADKFIVIGIGKDEIHFLTELDGSQLIEEADNPDSLKHSGFQDVLSMFTRTENGSGKPEENDMEKESDKDGYEE